MKIMAYIAVVIYNIFWAWLTIGGCIYIVFMLGESGWWFALFIPLFFLGYTSVTINDK
jgi:hypothetical protein